jgi:hypothetical protein
MNILMTSGPFLCRARSVLRKRDDDMLGVSDSCPP